jgi:predicted permease
VLGTIAATASLAAANAELSTLRRSIPDSVGTPLPLVARRATFFQTDVGEFEVFQQASVVFLAALVLMLGIAVVNLVNLFAARNASRESEVTVRLALGASRRRIARQLASESVWLALVGGALGLAASRFIASWLERWMTTTMSAISGGTMGVSLDLTTDWRVALYTVVLSIGIGLVVGLWPALRASRADINALLRQSVTSTAGAARWGKRHALLAVQIASCTVLLTAAGALLGGMRLSHHIDARFDADHILIVDLPNDPPIAREALRADVAGRLRAVAGVRAVSWTRRVPFGGTHLRTVNGAGSRVTLSLDDVDESYFDAMGMPVVRGRTFSKDEVERGAPVMVVSESAARYRWPAGDAVGRTVPPNDPLTGPDTTQAYTVIGVVPDIRSQFLSRMNGPAVYYPYNLHNERGALMVRTHGKPGSVVNGVRAVIASVSPTLANRAHVLTMQDGPMALQRFMVQVPAAVALGLALAGLLLASVGVYGVISQIVTRRTREIAIRRAMGASRGRVLWMVAVKTLRPVAWGLGAGGGLSVGVSLFLRSLIATADAPDLTFGAGAFNPTVFGAVAGVLSIVVAAAFAGPARRALAVDLVGSLRAD